ncbi:glycosyltransferase family 2 protein [Paenibacillus larvae]|nr:glycosyltransferase family 2 protein [Paenibacillus larvae]
MPEEKEALIIIPAYNEEDSIEKTVESVIQNSSYDYIVINDGSKDRTPQILNERQFNCLHLPVNMGSGPACRPDTNMLTGIIMITLFSLMQTGQHDPKDLDKLVAEIKKSQYDLVIGSRFVEKSSYKGSVSRRIGIYYFYLLIRLLTGNKITDPTSGYRIVNRKIIKEFSSIIPLITRK